MVDRTSRVLLIAVIPVFVFALWFWLSSASQPLIDQHTFRQTQTALTVLYLFTEGRGLLDYQTPVLGQPWSIPFEFPTYQIAVYLFHNIMGVGLSTSGRLVSMLFGLASLLVALRILRLFKVPVHGQLIFALLCLSSPVYLYWNRSFTIESTALFFTLSAFYFYCKCRLECSRGARHNWRPLLGLLCCLVIALLTKATTPLALALFIALDLVLLVGRSILVMRRIQGILFSWAFAVGGILLVSFVSLLVWTDHADSLKNANTFGVALTSSRLSGVEFRQAAAKYFFQVVVV